MHALPNPEEEPTVSIWPTAGRSLGLGRGATYAAVTRGDIPTVPAGGRKRRVPTAALREMLGLASKGDAA